jgi:hypothetical protein
MAKQISVMSMGFDMDNVPLSQLADDGFDSNECYPRMLVNDPTFAILNGDSYFARHGRAPDLQFANAPSPALTNGQNPPFGKRSLIGRDQSRGYAVDMGNTTRHLTPLEMDRLAQQLEYDEQLRLMHDRKGHVNCRGESCATEISWESKPSVTHQQTYLTAAMATASTTEISSSKETGYDIAESRRSNYLLAAPLETVIVP